MRPDRPPGGRRIHGVGSGKRRAAKETRKGETFKTFGQIVAAASPERLKELVPLVVEAVEWHEDPKSPGSGHYRLAYFEQPRLNIRKETPTEQSGSICSVGGNDWLPDEDSNLRGLVQLRLVEQHGTRGGAYYTLNVPKEPEIAPPPQSEEERVLAHVRERGSITNAQCCSLLGVRSRRANYLLKKLCDAHCLRAEGEGRWRRYVRP